MSDRELLEKAARAAGIAVIRSRLDDPLQGDMLIDRRPDQQPCGWNPLTDDGDALRLAVKLRLDVEWLDFHTVFVESAHHVFNDDPYAATRRAIVRAAASIGPTP